MTSLEQHPPDKAVESVQETSEAETEGEKTPTVTTTSNDEAQIEANTTFHSVFSKHTKRFIVFMTALAAMVSPMSSQIYVPVLYALSEYYRVTITHINLTVTTYMIVQGLAPSFMGTFADVGGRRPAYILCFSIYVLANLGLALQDNYAALLVLRAMQSAGSSATVSIGYGVMSDIAIPAERGRYMGVMGAGQRSSLSLGPILGGLLYQGFGWRSIFWFLVIFGGGYLAVYLMSMPETSRKLVGNGSIPLPSRWKMSGFQCLAANREKKKASVEKCAEDQKPRENQKLSLSMFNPLTSLAIFKDKAATINILHLSLAYSSTIAIQTSTANLFGQLYGLDTMKIGLCYIAPGIFGCVGSVVIGYILDMNYRRISHKLRQYDPQDFPFEKARLQVAIPLTTIMIIDMAAYGWILEYHVHLAVTLFVQSVQSFCSGAMVSLISTLLVDIFPEKPATANAASNIGRCWMGAVAAAVLDFMFQGIGWGWTFVVFAVLPLAFMPMLGLEYQRGLEWRKAKRERKE